MTSKRRANAQSDRWRSRIVGTAEVPPGDLLPHPKNWRLLAEAAGWAGYEIARWTGYYCGAAQDMTHYGAILVGGSR